LTLGIFLQFNLLPREHNHLGKWEGLEGSPEHPYGRQWTIMLMGH